MAQDEERVDVSHARTSNWDNIIRSVQTPVGLFALLILAIYAILFAVVFTIQDTRIQGYMGIGLVALLFVIVFVVALRPEIFANFQPLVSESPELNASDDQMDPSMSGDEPYADIVTAQGGSVLFATDTERPALGYWFHELRPCLHQAVHYSVPTYYLDTKLNVVDWNIAFELVFSDMIGHIRGKHVNWFIARLANQNQVFDHARRFTKNVLERGEFPYVDMEPIEYDSSDFGLVRMTKVASQLSNPSGRETGWAVALIPREINWDSFQKKLYDRIHADKRWSVYAASYDRVLLKFPPYEQLIRDVVSVVPSGSMSVADLGCGTGNVTKILLEKGHRVTAIEDNLGMLDRFASKNYNPESTKLIKSSVLHMGFLPAESFDAAVMVNVLYSLDDALGCLRNVYRILRPDGVLGLSTTHRDTNLDPLLNSIEETLKLKELREKLASDWETVYKVNKSLEKTVVRRYTRDQWREMLILAGFEITKEVSSTYEGAVMLIHARKRIEEPGSDSQRFANK